MNFIRNAAFALIGFIVINLFFYLLTLAFTSLIQWIVLNWILNIDSFLRYPVFIFCLMVIAGLMQAAGFIFSLIFTGITYIAKNARFSLIWTKLCLMLNLIYAGVMFWPGYVEIGGFLGIGAGMGLSLSFIWMVAAISSGATSVVKGRIMDEAVENESNAQQDQM